MTMEQVWTLLRQALLFAGGILVGKGYLDAQTMTAIVGAVLTIATSAYGIYKRSPTQIIETAAALPDVTKVVATGAIAAASPSMKVTST